MYHVYGDSVTVIGYTLLFKTTHIIFQVQIFDVACSNVLLSPVHTVAEK